ncbi:hypothetical protein P40081_15370 [Paenibacillus sp. FSL P4-0081]|uniref:hyaluronate lyase N-terminal domain-containing protein n=1 Tax=Paenibacillus sp. FSL P4-0081 TaxID=1536769 RepID=UPI0004F5F0EC|nr:hypothetical protein [Paenibacillus sp. FSL P4-0081]AIQ29375.1 hypothetical protein P40081_15370 [Paenibacillus sp. FSL P4-0081]
MANKIQLRRGTKAQLATLGALSAGEPGYTTDSKELFIGNGAGANTPVVTATSADITYYVRTDGNDGNTGLANTAGGAFKTITKAVSMLPQVINHSLTLNIAAGAYSESVVITGFTGNGRLDIVGDTVVSATRTVTSIVVTNNTAPIYIKGIRALNTAGAGFYGASNTNFGLEVCSIIASAPTQPGFDFGGGGMVSLNGCLASNRNAALNVNGAVMVVSYTWQAGSGNSYGVSVYFGKVGKAGTQPAGTTAEYVAAGGEISDSGVLNPWGDNTTSSRPGVSATSNTSQALSANVATKVLFDVEKNDNTNNFTNSTFTAPTSGDYLINAFVSILSLQAGSSADLYIYVNGAIYRRIGLYVNPGANGANHGIGGSAAVKLVAGDTVEVYAKAGNNANIAVGTDRGFECERIA